MDDGLATDCGLQVRMEVEGVERIFFEFFEFLRSLDVCFV